MQPLLAGAHEGRQPGQAGGLVVYVHAHLVGREVADVSHEAFTVWSLLRKLPRVRALAGLSTMINVLMLLSSQLLG